MSILKSLPKPLGRIALAAAASLGLMGAAQAYEAAATTDLNMRSGPGTQYRVVDTIPGGEIVRVGNCSGSWCRVDFDGLRGWASANYLSDVGRRAYREPVYVEPSIVVEVPIVRAPRIVRHAPPRYVDDREYRYHPYQDRRHLTPGPNGSAAGFGVSVSSGGTYRTDRFCYETRSGVTVCD